jgi:hypothetical protein
MKVAIIVFIVVFTLLFVLAAVSYNGAYWQPNCPIVPLSDCPHWKGN